MGDQSNDSNESQHVSDRGQDKGREDNAAQPPRTMDQGVDPASYPAAGRDDSVELEGEGRSFDPSVNAPTPRQGAGDSSANATNEGRIGPEGDPAEGRRD
jgi:hypothetical protein